MRAIALSRSKAFSALIFLLSLGPVTIDIVRVHRCPRKCTRTHDVIFTLTGSNWAWIERICRPGVWLRGAAVFYFRAGDYRVSSPSYQLLQVAALVRVPSNEASEFDFGGIL